MAEKCRIRSAGHREREREKIKKKKIQLVREELRFMGVTWRRGEWRVEQKVGKFPTSVSFQV